MPRRETNDFLPGVQGRVRPQKATTYDGRDAIARARRLANIRDIADTVILLGVDALFMSWDAARIPLLTRAQSLTLLMVVHAIFAIHIIATRVVPAIRARRVSSTWADRERSRFKIK